jgi:hypothetical protein
MTRLALIPGLVLVAALVGFGASDPTGHVGGSQSTLAAPGLRST